MSYSSLNDAAFSVVRFMNEGKIVTLAFHCNCLKQIGPKYDDQITNNYSDHISLFI